MDRIWLIAIPAGLLLSTATRLQAQPVVPGTGQRVSQVGDDFEDAKWSYQLNAPKASYNIDKQIRYPAGGSANGHWFESSLRGQPDVIKRVETPEGGLAGSKGSLLMQSLYTGVPNMASHEPQQDDLILNIAGRIGGSVSIARSPNIVVRVFLPPWEQWEQRSGNTFGLRAALETTKTKWEGGRRGGMTTKNETYWPAIFIQFNNKDARNKEYSAALVLRGDDRGHDFFGKKVTQTGWWTLGMSFTPDGQVHYYASPGVDDLTAKDYLASKFAYSYRAERFTTFFFNVINSDDGKTWSTPWVIDDPMLYFAR